MITPKLTAALVVMTALAGLAPGAVFAQERNTDDGTSIEDIVSNSIDLSQSAVQAADTSADDNVQVNSATVTQTQAAVATCDDDCEAEAEQEDLTQTSTIEQENEIETGDVDQEQDVEQEQELEDIVQVALDELELEF